MAIAITSVYVIILIQVPEDRTVNVIDEIPAVMELTFSLVKRKQTKV